MKSFEEIREATIRAMDDAFNDNYFTLFDAVILTLAAHGIDVRRIAAGELKVLERDLSSTKMCVAANASLCDAIECTCDETAIWKAAWDAAP